jgi:hypothetical protein
MAMITTMRQDGWIGLCALPEEERIVRSSSKQFNRKSSEVFLSSQYS